MKLKKRTLNTGSVISSKAVFSVPLKAVLENRTVPLMKVYQTSSLSSAKGEKKLQVKI